MQPNLYHNPCPHITIHNKTSPSMSTSTPKNMSSSMSSHHIPHPQITLHIQISPPTSTHHNPHPYITIHTSHSTCMWHYPCKHMAIQVHSLQSSCLPSFHSWRNLELEKNICVGTSILVGWGTLLPHPKIHGIQHLCLLWGI